MSNEGYQTGRIAAVHQDGYFGVFATAPIGIGETIFIMAGAATSTPSRISVQISAEEHLDVEVLQDPAKVQEGHFWQFLNHSCAPSACIRGRHVVAMRALQAGEEITFDYNTNELNMASPFECNCKSPQCRGRISGFANLTREEQLEMRPHIAGHMEQWLVRQFARSEAPAPVREPLHS